jgi:uncharacterized delta-60 repeat protein
MSSRVLGPIAAALLMALPASAREPGATDRSFGADGVAIATIGPADFNWPNPDVAALLAAPDGKLIVGATVTDGSGLGLGAFALARFTADGRLDSTYGANGSVHLQLGSGDRPRSSLTNLVLEPDGGVVAVGAATGPDGYGLAAARFDSSGGLLWSVVHPMGKGWGGGGPVQRQPDGKLVVGGVVQTESGGNGEMAIARLDEADGSLDSSFAGTGFLIDPTPRNPPGPACLPGSAEVSALALTHSGSIVAGGSVGYRCGTGGQTSDPIFRAYGPGGQRDTEFATGPGGLSAFSGLVVRPDGSFLAMGMVTGLAFEVPGFARYTSTGAPDRSFAEPLGAAFAPGFDSNGPSGRGVGFAVQPDGRLLGALVTYAPNRSTSRVVRMFGDGSRDPSFGRNGTAKLPFASASAMTLQPDGQIVVAGTPGSRHYGDNRIALTRLVGGLARGRVAIGASAPVRGRTARFSLACGPVGASRCTGTLSASFGSAGFALAAGERTTVRLQLDRATIRRLRRDPDHHLLVRVRATNGSAGPAGRRVSLHD